MYRFLLKDKFCNILLILVVFFLGICCVSCATLKEGVKLKSKCHHVFPQQFSEDFKNMGIDIDQYTIPLTKRDHLGVGKGLRKIPSGWNEQWGEFLKANPNATKSKVMKQLRKMMNDAGCKGEFIFYNYATNAPTGDTIFTFSNNFLFNFCGKRGYGLIKLFGGTKIEGKILSLLVAVGLWLLGLSVIKLWHPVAVGVGIIMTILGMSAFVGFLFFLNPFIVAIFGLVAVFGMCTIILHN